VQERTAGVGIVLLIMLAIFLTFNDLQRMFG
jgi:membrane-associated protease RseP (regulator of RpoE activity)